MTTTPCANCKTTGGYSGPDQIRPRRRDGVPFGFGGSLCHRCHCRHYNMRAAAAKPAKPRKAKQARDARPFVVDPAEHQGIIWTVALSLRNRGFDIEDLVSEGQIGLLKACRNYNPALKIKFATYATAVIRSAILRMIGSKAGLIRVPEYLHKGLRGGDAGAKNREHSECLAAARKVRSRQVFGEGNLAMPLANLAVARPETTSERNEEATYVANLLASLPEAEAKVLRLRFGFDEASQTLDQIGKSFGVSRETIQDWEARAIGRLRKQMGACA